MDIRVNINGVDYPCRPTMGAMLRFKNETGKEVTDIDMNSFSDICTYLYCCIKSACNADKIEFGYTLMDFADGISPEAMTQWVEAVTGGEDEKKR